MRLTREREQQGEQHLERGATSEGSGTASATALDAGRRFTESRGAECELLNLTAWGRRRLQLLVSPPHVSSLGRDEDFADQANDERGVLELHVMAASLRDHLATPT